MSSPTVQPSQSSRAGEISNPDSTTSSIPPLTCQPQDILNALSTASSFQKAKVTVQFNAVGTAMRLRQNVCKISSTQRFEAVVLYLRKMLKVDQNENLFLYVNSSFAPALDEVVGNLHRCFKNSNDHLVVTYSVTPAFG
ncbi:hypothetical protein K3495_g2248 [Podosphaera aphanis]|nr:hypothetical protein K3495_g2248 [Podosphaera aphanis]